jgi:16S rRNA processing protein RimM
MRLEVGKIDKAHGVHGDVVVTLLSDRTERLDAGSVLFRDDGLELTVKKSRSHQHRYIVEFDQIRGREQADAFRGTVLFGDPIEDPDVIWIHDLIGSPVVDLEGTALGTVESVLENPASDLLVLEDEALIPLTFFVEQREDRTIVVDPPEGLFDPIDASDEQSS